MSSPVLAIIWPPLKFWAIAKAYTTRVGEGPFPTEIKGPEGEILQKKGHEFGATTGRKRRCGWPDLPLLKYAAQTSNLTSLAITKLDILKELSTIKVCYAYRYQGKTLDMPFPGINLDEVTPLYREIPGLTDDFEAKKNDSAHWAPSQSLKHFLNMVENSTGVPIGLLAYGPEREDIEYRRDYF